MLQKISKYRAPIMGFSILWIMLFHSHFSFPAEIPLSDLANRIKNDGYGGVDILMFLSGFGLYLSLSHNPKVLPFFKRRLKRVLPTYIPALLLWQILFTRVSYDFFSVFLYNLTGISYWTGFAPLFVWFMPALVSFYLAAPVFFRILRMSVGGGHLHSICLLTFTLLMNLLFLGSYSLVAITRFTVFAMGMVAGDWYLKKRPIHIGLECFFHIAGIASFCLLQWMDDTPFPFPFNERYSYAHYPFIFIAPGMIFALCRIFSLLDSCVPGKTVIRFFEICGKCSLEIFLIHYYLLGRGVIVRFVSGGWYRWILVYLAIILASYLYYKLSQKAVDAITPYGKHLLKTLGLQYSAEKPAE